MCAFLKFNFHSNRLNANDPKSPHLFRCVSGVGVLHQRGGGLSWNWSLKLPGCLRWKFLFLDFSRGPLNHGTIHVNSRFRRDVRALDEDEELWFDQEDENGEENVTLDQSDLLNEDSSFKNRKTFVNEKAPPSIVNNKRVSASLVIMKNNS